MNIPSAYISKTEDIADQVLSIICLIYMIVHLKNVPSFSLLNENRKYFVSCI